MVVDAHSHWSKVLAMNSTTSEATIVVLHDLLTKYVLSVSNGPHF